jgi:outer membrane protein OmpA-like peptidoglycan-associated protein
MIRKYLIALLICSFASKADWKEVYNTDLGVRKYYQSYSDNNYNLTVNNNLMRIDFKSFNSSAFWENSKLNPESDFSIETKVRVVRSSENSFVGLIFGANDFSNCYQFFIRSNKDVSIIKKEQNNEENIALPGVIQSFKLDGNWNTIQIVKKGEVVRFILNEELIATVPKFKFFGRLLGYFVSNPSLVEFENIIAHQEVEGINTIAYKPRGIKKENLGSNVNSECNETLPVVSYDGNTLYLTTEGCKYNTGGPNDGNDIFISELDSLGKWQPRKNAGKPLNNIGPNWVISVTPDNNTLLLSNTYKPDGSNDNKSGISRTNRTSNGWEIPKSMVFNNFSCNSPFWQQCLSSDRRALIISSKCLENYGGNDLYVCLLQDDDSWGSPINLSNIVNTHTDEIYPFLAADGKTLYFASEGHPGYGKFDLFMSKRLDDSWTNWTKPINLGDEINTKGIEYGFSIPASGEFAYMVTDENSLGGTDIVKINLPKALKPESVILVKGVVRNSKTNEIISAPIEIKDIKTKKLIGKAISNPKDGSYQIVLPAGKKYAFEAKQEGFYAKSKNFDLPKIDGYKEVIEDLLLTPIEKGATLSLNNLFFETASAELNDDSKLELDKLVDLLTKYSDFKILIEGHTDNVGNSGANRKLSTNRAEAVRQYLLEKGFAKSRLLATGFGSTKPIVSNKTEDGRKQNRRVVVKILD